MKFWKLYILLIALLISITQSQAKSEYDDPLNLTNDSQIKQHYYTYNNAKMLYSEIYENRDKRSIPTIILVLHSGVQRSNVHPKKHLTNPGLQSLIRYIRKHKIKTIIIAPQYPLAASAEEYRYPQKYNDLVMQLFQEKIKEYNVPKDRVFAVSTCVGGIALSDILNIHQDLFKKAVFVASKNMNSKNFVEGKFITEIYLVQGDRDSIRYKIDLVETLKKKSIKVTLKILKDTNHARSLEMDVGYPDCLWKWLFKYDYKSLPERFKYMFCKT